MKKRVNNPKVSVVIPTYNNAKDLPRCLDSLLAQDLQDFEVLICDDGSTDDTSSIVETYLPYIDITYSYGENFGGPARPRNRGITLARAPYVAFLDSDDWWAPEKLSLSLATLDEGADVVYHDLFITRTGDQVQYNERTKASKPVHPLFTALLCTGISIPNSSVVLRKDLITRIGGISEKLELVSVEDYDTWIRLSRLTERFVRIPECLGYYWFGGGNISASSPKQVVRIRALYNQYINELPVEYQRRAQGFLAYRIGRIAQNYGDFVVAVESMKQALVHPIDLVYRVKAAYFLMLNLLLKWK